MTFRSTCILLLALLLLAALFVATLLHADSSVRIRSDSPPPTRLADPVGESAIERLQRLRPGLPADLTRMRPPLAEPTIERMMLRQTRHAGHVGLFTQRPASFTPVAVVVHATGDGRPGSEFGSLEDLGAFFQRQGVAASHYGVDRRGRITQYIDDAQAAFHVSRPGWNDISIGIELLNDNTGRQPFPPAQLSATRRLIQTLGDRYGIPAEAVVAHRTIQPEDRRDPASNFPWDAFVSSLGAPDPERRVAVTRRSGVGAERLEGGHAGTRTGRD